MTQVLSANDSFAGGSTAPPSANSATNALKHYIRQIPWTSDPAYGSGGSGFSGSGQILNLPCTTGQLYNGWSPRAALSSGGLNLTVPRVMSIMPRAIELTTVDVAASFQLQTFDQAYIGTFGAKAALGVGARLSSGSVAGTTVNDIRLEGGNGYWFVLLQDNATSPGFRLQLWRINSGTITRLANSPNDNTTFAIWVGPYSARTMRMTIADESGDVRIRCYTQRTLPNGRMGAEIETFSVLDSSGSKITAAGRTGLMLTSEYRPTTGALNRLTAMTVNWFQVTSGSTVVWRDEWTRLYMPWCDRRFPTGGTYQAEFDGNSLMSGWAFDAQYFNTPQAVFDNTADSVVAGLNGGVYSDIWAFSQRPADDPRRQDRTLTATFINDAAAVNVARSVGIILRATPQVGAANARASSAYYVRVLYNDQTAATLIELHRIVSTVDVVIARDVTTTVALDVAFDLSMKIETQTVPDPISGYVRIEIAIDTVPLELVEAVSPVSGIVTDGSGVVIDTSSARVFFGNGEGWLAATPSANTRTIQVLNWTQGSGAEPIEEIEVDQPSIEVPTEADVFVGTLYLPIESTVRQTNAETVIRHEMESDHVMSSLMHEFERRTWAVEAFFKNVTERDEFLDLVEAAHGIEGAFYWWPPARVPIKITVHFTTENIEVTQIVPGVWRASFGLEGINA